MMRTRLLRYAHLLAVLVVATIVAGCSFVAEEPPRPAGVPADAFWVGGPDGGVFMRLEPTADNGATYRGAVYNEFTGSVWYEGRFILEPAGSPPVNVRDRRILSGWDGVAIHLTDGRALMADVK
jgi:hypothetical protein